MAKTHALGNANSLEYEVTEHYNQSFRQTFLFHLGSGMWEMQAGLCSPSQGLSPSSTANKFRRALPLPNTSFLRKPGTDQIACRRAESCEHQCSLCATKTANTLVAWKIPRSFPAVLHHFQQPWQRLQEALVNSEHKSSPSHQPAPQ